jgi:deoxycytidylate deaminase
MKLEKFYSLRKDFVLIGLTGRVGSGCSEVAKKLSNPNFVQDINYTHPIPLLHPEDIKFNICVNYLKSGSNFEPFCVINYKDVLFLNLLFEATANANPLEYIIQVITQYGDGFSNYKGTYTNRFGIASDNNDIEKIRTFLNPHLENIILIFKNKNTDSLHEWLKEQDKTFSDFYFDVFAKFSHSFYNLLNKINSTKRSRFSHDISINLREVGKCLNQSQSKTNNNLEFIYFVADSINRIIKLHRQKNNKSKVVIDSLKNSLELMYFKEKYSSFYMVAINRDDKERYSHVESVLKATDANYENHLKELIHLDNSEYKSGDVNKGQFATPDIENCIQKSGYHIYHSNNNEISSENKHSNLEYQLVKLLSLISQPGIITPTPTERTMQIAFNAKYNSGCISRQVGAVVTDKDFSVKAVGWNDVAQHQMPCNLRSVSDLINGKQSELFSEYEKIGGSFKYTDKDKSKTFRELVSEDLKDLPSKINELEGRNCSFCFKTFENAYEKEKNQVHTRSLHAEENAMLQISKKGGNGLMGGYLFTTASPCELCAKKAFQLGITKIFYIDPYPGISMTHILKSAVQDKNNPELEMFKGAVGRTFHKLYEPFMAYKDELNILTGLKPVERTNQKELINILIQNKKNLTNSTKKIDVDMLQEKIEKLISEHLKEE